MLRFAIWWDVANISVAKTEAYAHVFPVFGSMLDGQVRECVSALQGNPQTSFLTKNIFTTDISGYMVLGVI